MKKLLLALAASAALAGPVAAQSVPNSGTITPGQIWTASQWTSAWQSKQDTLGYTPANRAGDTFTGVVTIPSLIITGTMLVPDGTIPQSAISGGDGGFGSLTRNNSWSGDQTFLGAMTGTLTGNASTATKWAQAITLTHTGDATGSVTFDGSAGVSEALTLPTVNVNVGQCGSTSGYPLITLDGKGRATGCSVQALGTAAFAALGTSGSAVPQFNTNGTWSGNQSFQGTVNFGTIGNFYALSSGTANVINWAPNVYTQWDTSTSKFTINTAAGKSVAIDTSANVTTPGTVTASGGVSTPSISGMTTALSVAQGGTGATSLTGHTVVIGNGTGNLHVTGTMAAGQVLVGQGATADPGVETLSGDATLAATGALTLSTVNSNVGACGTSSSYPQITLDAKGRATGCTAQALGTAAFAALGTSGTAVPQLSGANTWGGDQTFTANTIATIMSSRGVVYPMDPPYNCYGDGLPNHDDTACMQSAINASANKVLWLGPHKYTINGTLSTPSAPIHVEGVGTGWNSNITGQDQSSCLYNIKANTLFFTLATGSSLRNFCIMAAGVHAVAQGDITISGSVATITNASGGAFSVGDTITYTGVPAGLTIASLGTGTGGNGTYNLSSAPGDVASPIVVTSQAVVNTSTHYAISIPPSAQDVTIDNLWVDGACITADVNGGNHKVMNSRFTGVLGAGCHGVRVGYFTQTASSVDDKLINLIIQGVSVGGSLASNPADDGIAVYDAGGLFLQNDDNLYETRGLRIAPGTGNTGANQQVIWLFCNNTAAGDTTANQGISIDTSVSSNQALGLNFNACWSSSTLSGDENTINNTGGGTVTDILFNNHRSYAKLNTYFANGLTIGSGVGTVTLSASEICGYTAAGIDMKSSAQNLNVTGSRISPKCAGLNASGTAAINFEGSNDLVSVSGNNFIDNGAQTTFTGTGLTGATHVVIGNNLPIDNNSATLPAGAITSGVLDFTNGGTISNLYPSYFISANGATITGFSNLGYSGRYIRLQATSGVTFTIGGGTNAAGSIASPSISVAPFQSVQCYYGGVYLSCWGH